MIKASLKFKVGFYLVIALTVAVFIFTLMIVRNNREVLLQQAVADAGRALDQRCRRSPRQRRRRVGGDQGEDSGAGAVTVVDECGCPVIEHSTSTDEKSGGGGRSYRVVVDESGVC